MTTDKTNTPGAMEQAFLNATKKKPKTKSKSKSKSKLPPVKLQRSTIVDYAALKQQQLPTQQELVRAAELKRAQEELNKSLSNGIGTQMDYAVWKLKNKDWL